MTNSQGLGLLAAAAIVGLIGLPLAFGEGDTQDLGSVAFAVALVMAIAALAAIAKNLYRADRDF